MTVDKFITQYKLTLDDKKSEFLTGHITTKYVPYLEKVASCNVVVNKTTYKTITIQEEEKLIFCKNTPMQFVMFMLILIDKYTDVQIEWGDKMIPIYDKLNEIGLINALISNIPQSEYTEFDTILKMVINDEYENTRDLVSWLDTKVEAYKLVDNSFKDILKEFFENNENKE